MSACGSGGSGYCIQEKIYFKTLIGSAITHRLEMNEEIEVSRDVLQRVSVFGFRTRAPLCSFVDAKIFFLCLVGDFFFLFFFFVFHVQCFLGYFLSRKKSTNPSFDHQD